MSDDIAMPLSTVRLIVDGSMLDAEAFGAHVRLLCHWWHSGGRYLADDNAQLARLAGVTKRRFRDKIRPQIIEFYKIVDGGWFPTAGHIVEFGGKRLPWSVWSKLRAEIFDRDGHECTYCGSLERLECDHVIPISRGGTNHKSNLTTACFDCNRSKGATVITGRF